MHPIGQSWIQFEW